jgi:hypothetical protein
MMNHMDKPEISDEEQQAGRNFRASALLSYGSLALCFVPLAWLWLAHIKPHELSCWVLVPGALWVLFFFLSAIVLVVNAAAHAGTESGYRIRRRIRGVKVGHCKP